MADEAKSSSSPAAEQHPKPEENGQAGAADEGHTSSDAAQGHAAPGMLFHRPVTTFATSA